MPANSGASGTRPRDGTGVASTPRQKVVVTVTSLRLTPIEDAAGDIKSTPAGDDQRLAREAGPRIAVDAEGAAVMFSVSKRLWGKLKAAGKVPAPFRLGKRVLWRVAELQAWCDARCPSRATWERQKDERP